jgi:DNA-binding beta-propeller fold protein YncE
MRSSIFGLAAAAAAALPVSVYAGPVAGTHQLIGLEFGSPSTPGNLFDINKSTAATSNPRPTSINDGIDIAYSPGGTLYGASANNQQLYTINPATGASLSVGSTGLPNLIEGGLAFSPGGTLYGAFVFPDHELVTINPVTGAASNVGPMTGSDDVSALAVNSSGTLYALDLHTNTGLVPQLYTLNTSTGAILTTTTLSASLGSALAGMAFDPDTGALYVAASGTDSLYTVNTSTGVLSSVGSLGGPGADVSGIAFVTIPEPTSTALACVAAGTTLLGRTRRRRAGG